MIRSPTRRAFLTVCASAAAAAALGSASETRAADFSGETIEIIVPAAEGGGTDIWARFYAPLLQRYLPGEPAVVVRNLPGGGHTTGGNFFANNAQPDGLMLLASSGTGHFNYLLGDSRVQYEFADMRTIAASPVGGVMYVAADLDVSGPEDIPALREKQLRYGSQGPTSQDLLSFYALEQLGIIAEPIFGMTGRSDARLAFERGDLNIDYQSAFAYDRNIAPLVEAGEAVPIFTFGMLDAEGNLIRDPAFPDLPHFGEAYEMVHGTSISGIEEEVYMSFFAAGFGAQKLLSLPADTPEDIIAAYVSALEAAQQDPEYEGRKEELLGPYAQSIGDEAERMKAIATKVSPEARAAVADWLKERFDTAIQ
jgi:tripartite-type tricarboxylate transporter receptor subunit TctC